MWKAVACNRTLQIRGKRMASSPFQVAGRMCSRWFAQTVCCFWLDFWSVYIRTYWVTELGSVVIMMTPPSLQSPMGESGEQGSPRKQALLYLSACQLRAEPGFYKLSKADKRARLCKYVPFYKISKCPGQRKKKEPPMNSEGNAQDIPPTILKLWFCL